MSFKPWLSALVLLGLCSSVSAQEKWADDCAQAGGKPLLGTGCGVLDDFMKAFNSRNGADWAKTLNFPHVRLAGDDVVVWKTPEDYAASNDVAQLATKSGWVRSAWDWRRLVQSSPDKLHFLVQFTRYGEADKKLASYESLYILTLKDGHWGVQARSSFAGVAVKGSAF